MKNRGMNQPSKLVFVPSTGLQAFAVANDLNQSLLGFVIRVNDADGTSLGVGQGGM
jgi:hypothetical protein